MKDNPFFQSIKRNDVRKYLPATRSDANASWDKGVSLEQVAKLKEFAAGESGRKMDAMRSGGGTGSGIKKMKEESAAAPAPAALPLGRWTVTKWFRDAGGIRPRPGGGTGRFGTGVRLTYEDRVEIMVRLANETGADAIADAARRGMDEDRPTGLDPPAALDQVAVEVEEVRPLLGHGHQLHARREVPDRLVLVRRIEERVWLARIAISSDCEAERQAVLRLHQVHGLGNVVMTDQLCTALDRHA